MQQQSIIIINGRPTSGYVHISIDGNKHAHREMYCFLVAVNIEMQIHIIDTSVMEQKVKTRQAVHLNDYVYFTHSFLLNLDERLGVTS